MSPKELIACGADVNDADTSGWTPLYAAIDKGDAKMTAILLNTGGDISATMTSGTPWKADRSPKQDSNSTSAYRMKVIRLALSHPPSREAVQLPLDHGADPVCQGHARPHWFHQVRHQVAQTPDSNPLPGCGRYALDGENRFREVLGTAELLVQRGAVVGDLALGLTVDEVAVFEEGYEELWEVFRRGY